MKALLAIFTAFILVFVSGCFETTYKPPSELPKAPVISTEPTETEIAKAEAEKAKEEAIRKKEGGIAASAIVIRDTAIEDPSETLHTEFVRAESGLLVERIDAEPDPDELLKVLERKTVILEGDLSKTKELYAAARGELELAKTQLETLNKTLADLEDKHKKEQKEAQKEWEDHLAGVQGQLENERKHRNNAEKKFHDAQNEIKAANIATIVKVLTYLGAAGMAFSVGIFIWGFLSGLTMSPGGWKVTVAATGGFIGSFMIVAAGYLVNTDYFKWLAIGGGTLMAIGVVLYGISVIWRIRESKLQEETLETITTGLQTIRTDPNGGEQVFNEKIGPVLKKQFKGKRKCEDWLSEFKTHRKIRENAALANKLEADKIRIARVDE